MAVLLNRVVLEYIPKHGRRLAEEVRKWGMWIKEQAEKELAEFYPKDPDGATPIAYLWARTIRCEGPGCGVEVPLIRSLWLAKRKSNSVALKLTSNPDKKIIEISIIRNATEKDAIGGTVKRASTTCPICGYTTPASRVREQLKQKQGGSDSSRLICKCTIVNGLKEYRLPSKIDIDATIKIHAMIKRSDIIPEIDLPLMSGVFNIPIYGMNKWDLMFSERQLLSAEVLSQKLKYVKETYTNDELRDPLLSILAIIIDKSLDFRTTLCGWISKGEKIGHTFGRQALGMIFDWVEGTCTGDVSGSWDRCTQYVLEFMKHIENSEMEICSVGKNSATSITLPDDITDVIATDPPYYNAVPYADLSDFFQIWLHKNLGDVFPGLFISPKSPKDEEICEMAGWDPIRYSNKNRDFYENGMRLSFNEARRCCKPNGLGVIVFAHKETGSWESLLQALITAGWKVTGSWPLDTERSGRLRAMDSAALASSVHLVCRPRKGAASAEETGDWRDVLQELPQRIHEWMPRLAAEGVVGADAIFACLGPALEIFSRYERVEKANGDIVTLREYLEQVWAAVSKEALNLIFSEADATGFEEDARLTAMWLWTLSAAGNGKAAEGDDEAEDDEDEAAGKSKKLSGFTLEYDAARKIAQGLGVHMDKMPSLVETKGKIARLLPVAERAGYLFGKEKVTVSDRKAAKKKNVQLSLFEEMKEEIEETLTIDASKVAAGKTVLDKVHQAMLLFAHGRGDALKRFIVEGGVGNDSRFWKLAQALSALYPGSSEEKRWVDGLLARKKGLGF